MGRAASLAVCVLWVVPVPAAAAAELAPGVHLLPGRFVAGTQPDGNTVILAAPQGLVVIDTGRHAAHAQAVIDFARQAERPVAAIVNTHWHLDHIGGNAPLRRLYPDLRVHASDALAGALGGFLADYRAYLQGALDEAAGDSLTQAPLRAELAILDAAPALGPDEVVERSGERRVAGRPLVLELETHAVTAGDVWVFDPATRLLVAGDLVTLPAPFFDTACPTRWQAALEHLDRTDFAILVPGHGPPMDRQSFGTWRRAFDNLLAAAAAREKTVEECTDGWLQDVGDLVPEGDRDLARSLVAYYIENHLRGDPAKIAELCGD
jgi:glyoxylase-like metal-dependent hydrolase (beta-lactamase superfamily II)